MARSPETQETFSADIGSEAKVVEKRSHLENFTWNVIHCNSKRHPKVAALSNSTFDCDLYNYAEFELEWTVHYHALPLNYKQQEHVNLRSALPRAIAMWGTLELENCFKSPTVK